MNSWRSSFLILDFAFELGGLVFFCVDNDEDPFVYNVAGSGRLQFGFSFLYRWIVYPDSSFNEIYWSLLQIKNYSKHHVYIYKWDLSD